MKRFNALVASGAFLATATVAMAPAGAVGVVSSKTVQALDDSECTAMTRGDFTAVRDSLAPNFNVKGPSIGSLQTRDQALETMQSNMEAANFGDDVVAVVEVTVSGWADPASGTIAPVTIRTIEEDRWTPAGSGFQEVASTQRDLTFTMGGQVLQHLGSG
ncbi:MAG: hypothetical protein ACXVAF_11645 [Vulcanimicrobiaceae bacterium]